MYLEVLDPLENLNFILSLLFSGHCVSVQVSTDVNLLCIPRSVLTT